MSNKNKNIINIAQVGKLTIKSTSLCDNHSYRTDIMNNLYEKSIIDIYNLCICC